MAAKRTFGPIFALALVGLAATQFTACSYLSTGESSAHYTVSPCKQPVFSDHEQVGAEMDKAFMNLQSAGAAQVK